MDEETIEEYSKRLDAMSPEEIKKEAIYMAEEKQRYLKLWQEESDKRFELSQKIEGIVNILAKIGLTGWVGFKE